MEVTAAPDIVAAEDVGPEAPPEPAPPAPPPEAPPPAPKSKGWFFGLLGPMVEACSAPPPPSPPPMLALEAPPVAKPEEPAPA